MVHDKLHRMLHILLHDTDTVLCLVCAVANLDDVEYTPEADDLDEDESACYDDDTADECDDDSADEDEDEREDDLLADDDDDLNVTTEGDDPNEYGAMDSGDENCNDDADEEDSDASDDEAGAAVVHDDAVDDDGSDPSVAQVADEIIFAESFLERFGGEDTVLGGSIQPQVLRAMSATGWEDVVQSDTYDYMQSPYEPVDNSNNYPGLRQAYAGPSAATMRLGDSPVALWQHVATSSNEYFRENLARRVENALKRYKARRRTCPDLTKKTKRDIYHEVSGTRPFAPHELCRFVGLLITRTIAPNREKLANHWRTMYEGAIGRGMFGVYLSSDRFMDIARNLHFNPNKDPRAKTDRAWKIRKVVEVLQKTFVRGYVAPSKLAFDEAILPSHSSFNKMRIYMKDKPHKWGTKLFMLCSAEAAYCIRYVFFVSVVFLCGIMQFMTD